MLIINSMELVEEKPKKRTFLYIIIIVLIIAIGIVYFVFFSSGDGLGGIIGGGEVEDFSLVPEDLQKDVTGGIVDLKFTPEDILQNPEFTSLQSYSEPVELRTIPGRSNPFIPF